MHLILEWQKVTQVLRNTECSVRTFLWYFIYASAVTLCVFYVCLLIKLWVPLGQWWFLFISVSQHHSNTDDGNVNGYNHYGKQYEGSPKNKKRTTLWSSYPTSGYLSKENICSPKVARSIFYNSPWYRNNLHAHTASQVAWVGKNPPAIAGDAEMQVQSLGWDNPLMKGTATHSRILAWRIPWTEGPGGLVHGVTKSEMQLSD